MLRTRCLALTVALLAVSWGRAAEPADDLKSIRQLLADIQSRQLTDESASAKQMQAVTTKLDDMRTMLEANLLNATIEINNLKKQVEKLQRDLADLRAQGGGATQSSSFRTPVSPTPPTAAPSTATLKFVNYYPTAVDAIVNGSSYPVEAGKVLTLAVTAGSLVTYGVAQVPQLPRTRTFAPNENIEITVSPRQ